MNIEDAFEVRATPERTWAFLNDVLGPIALRLDTEVIRTAADPEAHRVELQAKAREMRGRGRATATIASQ